MYKVIHQDPNLVAEQGIAAGVKVAFAGQTKNITGQSERPVSDRWEKKTWVKNQSDN